MTVIFPTLAALSAVPATPSGVTIGTPLQSVDGRCAVCHPFGHEDAAFFAAMPGVVVANELPSDWQPPSGGD